MSEEEETEEEGSTRTTLIIALAGAMLPVIYVLSLGPVILLVGHGYIPNGPFETIYSPLEWLHKNSDFCRAGLDAYISLYTGFMP